MENTQLLELRVLSDEIQGAEYQVTIKSLLGRPASKAESLAAVRMNEEVGDGGNTIGWKFDRAVNREFQCSHAEHTLLGDSLCALGRLATENHLVKWCFPETFKASKLPVNVTSFDELRRINC